MKHAFISIGEHDILSQYELSSFLPAEDETERSLQDLWKEWLALDGLEAYSSKDMLKAVFSRICEEFSKTYKETIPIHLREGFITQKGSQSPVRHSDASRMYASGHTVYLDLLMSSVLFSFSSVFYLYALKPNDPEVVSGSFKQSLYIFDGCCRKGLFPNRDGLRHLLDLIHDRLTAADIGKISDLYSCMLAFAVCHEAAHIYLHHDTPNSKEEARQQEFQADHAGYDIFLKLMLNYKDCTDDVPENIFREYLYTAPMILFLFYHCLFTTGYWLFGEQISDSHPDPMERIEQLLEISQEEQYDFDTEEGNAFLAGYWNVADQYLEELWYKLKNGKLSRIIRNGDEQMNHPSTVDEVYAIHDQIIEKIEQFAKDHGYDAGQCIGLWDTTAFISAEAADPASGFILDLPGQKTVSIKPINIIYKQSVLLTFLVSGLTISLPQTPLSAGKIALYILFNLAIMATTELKDEQINTLLYLHKQQAYTHLIPEDEILRNVAGSSHDTISDLDHLGCIEIIDGKVRLREKVCYRIR